MWHLGGVDQVNINDYTTTTLCGVEEADIRENVRKVGQQCLAHAKFFLRSFPWPFVSCSVLQANCGWSVLCGKLSGRQWTSCCGVVNSTTAATDSRQQSAVWDVPGEGGGRPGAKVSKQIPRHIIRSLSARFVANRRGVQGGPAPSQKRPNFLISNWSQIATDQVLVRPPGTSVQDGLMFYPSCFFLFLFRHAFSEVPRPIALKLCHMVGIWPKFIILLRKFGGRCPQKIWGQKHAKFRYILDHFRLWSRISPHPATHPKSERCTN